MALACVIHRQRRAVVRAGVYAPGIEGGALQRLGRALAGQAQQSVVALAVGEQLAPHQQQTAVAVLGESQTAALAGMVGQLVFGGKIAPAVIRVRGIQRRTAVLAAGLLGGQTLAAVDPDQLQAPVRT
ncbi:hypothetical protein D9M68_926090 [compost metagenome]